MKTKINAQIVAHSVNEQGDELISVLATFPRIILAEVNTHRMLSKNTSSSRAIPFNKMVETIQNDPFIPIAWQKEHKGMQGTEYFGSELFETHKPDNWIQPGDAEENETYVETLTAEWLMYRDSVVEDAIRFNSLGVTKQLANRLLEPFMWTTMLITGPKSGWDNFFNLRCPQYQTPVSQTIEPQRSWKDLMDNHSNEDNLIMMEKMSVIEKLQLNKGQAEIHMMALAECIWDAVSESTPKVLKAGEWHIPFEDKLPTLKVAYTDDGLDYKEKCTTEDKVFMSVAMAARTSYTVVGEEKELNPHALIGLHDRLLAWDPPHSSPLEHCAQAMTNEEYWSSFGTTAQNTKGNGWCNNLKGFIPYRYMVDNGRVD